MEKKRYRFNLSIKSMKKAFFYLTILLLIACKHDPVTLQPDITPPSNKCPDGVVSFEADVLPIFQSKCATVGCHDNPTYTSGLVLTSYTNAFLTGSLVPGDTANSDLYKRIMASDSTQMPPATYTGLPLTGDEKTLITNWILQNTPNNNCTH